MELRINDIAIPENEKDFLKAVYQNKYNAYLVRRDEILQEGKDMEPMLLALGIIQKESEKEDVKYNSMNLFQQARLQSVFVAFDLKFNLFGDESQYQKDNWTWLQKCRYIIDIANQPLTSNEIIEVLIKFFEPELDRQKLINSIPATLSVAAKDGKLIRTQKDGEFAYGIS